MPRLSEIQTPAAIVDLERLQRNCMRMKEKARAAGVRLRPHLKTAKSAEVAALATEGGNGPIVASTLSEIDYFGRAGFLDITYAVGISAAKIPTLAGLKRALKVEITLIADSVEAIRAVSEAASASGASFPFLIEIDCGGGRGGVAWDGPELIAIAEAIKGSGCLTLAGVLTHAGHSYATRTTDQIIRIAEDERLAAVSAARRLRERGFAAGTVSVGSTPTCTFARSFEGVTEIRPGVYTFNDLDQVMLGVCATEDIAASVLTTVIGHNPRSDRLLIDAGGLALSKDLSADHFDGKIGYGLVCREDSLVPVEGVHVAAVHQEHGFIAIDRDRAGDFAPEIGTRLRIVPNHACMTVAPYDHYHVVGAGSDAVIAVWSKACGW
jgi:D-serine deaminase-like pyridoxal phosphate-dependent protein